MSKLWTRSVAVVLAVVVCAALVAQAGEAGPAEQEITRESVQAGLAHVQEAEDFDASAKEAAIKLYEQAERLIASREDARARKSAAEQEAAGIRSTVQASVPEPNVQATQDSTLSELEQGLAQAKATRSSAEARIDELDDFAVGGGRQTEQIAQQLVSVREELRGVEQQLAAQDGVDEPAVVKDARRIKLLAQQRAMAMRVAALEAEIALAALKQELLPQRRARAKAMAEVAAQEVERWQELVTAKRRAQAAQVEREAEQLRREAARRHPVLQEYAEQTSQYAGQLAGTNGITAKQGRTAEHVAQVKRQLDSLTEQFEQVRRRMEITGFDRATGVRLRRAYEELPNLNELRGALRQTREQAEQTAYIRIDLEELQQDTTDTQRNIEALMRRIDTARLNGSVDEVHAIAEELVRNRQAILSDLISAYNKYDDELVSLRAVQRDLLNEATTYSDFIEERILWVRSISADRGLGIADVGEGVGWLVDKQRWSRMFSATQGDMRRHWIDPVVGGLGVILLFLVARPIRRRLRDLADRVARYRTDRFLYTLHALLLTAVLAARGPAVLVLLWWILTGPSAQTDFGLALGAGVLDAAMLLWPMSLLRQVLRPKGLGEAHFRWPKATVASLRRHLRWFVPVAVACSGVVAMVEADGAEAAGASVGRAVFTAGLVAYIVFMLLTLRPGSVSMSEAFKRIKGGLAERFWYVWYPLAVGFPALLILLAWLGYYYTAQQLQIPFEQTLLLTVLIVLAQGLLGRWLFMARRRLAVEDARRRREQAIEDAKAKSEGKGGAASIDSDVPAAAFDEDKVDLPAISAQTQQLFKTVIVVTVLIGLYAIWADVLPALRMLDRVQVWPDVRVVEANSQDTTNAAAFEPERMSDAQASSSRRNEPSSSTPSIYEFPGQQIARGANESGDSAQSVTQTIENAITPVTLADVGFAVIVLVGTWIAFRNLPGMAEIVVLQRLPLDSGIRYALSTVFRYIIAIVGIIVVFNALNLSWTKIQWLAAALTFGLAFGLQEIFANFVSGLIILAERPIRIGDTVTVGQTIGTVTRIRMRATTIVDWDRKELVIPNKTFIVSDVINWTLSDSVLRVVIPVGVSYGADVEKAERILREIAFDDPMVLDDPKPQALFLGFGDSTLNFELRVYIPHVDYLISIKHTMHMKIIKRFRAASIEIAFPQRDLHVRSVEGIEHLFKSRGQAQPDQE